MNTEELLYEIEIPRYPSRIKLSEKRKPTYYPERKSEKIPKKYKNSDKHGFRGGYLVDLETNERVVKNSRSVGTPRYWTVNFQAIWNQAIKYQQRANITSKLKDIFRPYIESLDPITVFPIRIEIFLHDIDMPVDVDNKGVVYTKVITDLLVNTNKGEADNKSIIPDDSSQYINDAGRCKWIEVQEQEDIKMIVRIWKSNNFPI